MPVHPVSALLPTEHTHSFPTLPRAGFRGAGLTKAEGETREDTWSAGDHQPLCTTKDKCSPLRCQSSLPQPTTPQRTPTVPLHSLKESEVGQAWTRLGEGQGRTPRVQKTISLFVLQVTSALLWDARSACLSPPSHRAHPQHLYTP